MLLAPALSCGADPATDDGIAYFERYVRPLLASHCYSCHSVRANKSEGDLVLDSRAAGLRVAKTGLLWFPETSTGVF